MRATMPRVATGGHTAAISPTKAGHTAAKSPKIPMGVWVAGLWVAIALAFVAGSPAQAQSGTRAADAKPSKKPADDSSEPKAIGGSGGLVVGGVDVDVGGKNPTDARFNGWREAQRLAWPALWARMSGQPPQTAPRLADGALDSIVSAIEVEREQVGPNRYVARLAVVFDRARAATFLGRYATLVTSPPMLLLPVLQDAGVRQAHEAESPWLKAWARLRAGESPVDYIRIQATSGDIILLNAWQAERRHVVLWRSLVDRYQVADVLIPELILDRSYLGGPTEGLLIVRFGPSGKELGRVRLKNAAGDVDGLMDTAVRQADAIYIAALRSGNLLPDPSLLEDEAIAAIDDLGPEIGGELGNADSIGGMRLRVQTPDDAALQGFERDLKATDGVYGVRVVSFAPGGESLIELQASTSVDSLRYALDQKGLRLVDDAGGRVLRRRLQGEAPIAAPVGAGEAAGEAAIVEDTSAVAPAAPARIPAAVPAAIPAAGPKALLPPGGQ